MMKKELDNVVIFAGCAFITGISKKFDKDLKEVMFILSKAELTTADRFKLLTIYQAAYHTGGKIEGVTSYDSSATNCSFCKAMRAKAEKNPAHICNFCYDKNQEEYKITAMNRHSLNLVIMSTVEFSAEELQIIPAGLINRINSSGDIPNKTYAINMIRIAKNNRFATFAFWVKNKLALIAATDEEGKPENAIYIQSSEIIGRPEEPAKYFDYVFTVYPDKASTLAAIAAGAAECNGKKCRECGYKCYKGTHKGVHIAELLRGVNAAKRAEIIAYLDEN